MKRYHDLLTSHPLEGPTAITRIFGPRPIARFADVNNWDDAVNVLEMTCSEWGGAYNTVVPAVRDSSPAGPWRDLLADSNISETVTRGVVPMLDHYRAEYGGIWTYDNGGEPIISVIARLSEEKRPAREVQAANFVNPEDPWYLAYLGIWGRLKLEYDQPTLQFLGLKDELTLDQVVTLSTGEDFVPGAEHLLSSLRDRQRITASELSCVLLSVAAAPHDSGMSDTSILPVRGESARRVGPNIVVVYEPGSVADLCLIWHLRALHGLPAGFPLAVPVSANVEEALRYWKSEFAMKLWGVRGANCVLVSASVGASELETMAAQAGSSFSAADYRDFLQAKYNCGHWSQETVNFSEGRARIPLPSPAETQWFGSMLLDKHSNGMELTVVPERWELPSLRTMRRQSVGNEPRFDRGVIVGCSRMARFAEISYVSGLDVLHASAQDRNLYCAPSAPGVIAEQFIDDIGLDKLYPLFSPDVYELMTKLCERRGVSYLNRRLREILKDDVDEAADGKDRLTRIEERLRKDAGAPDEFDQIELGFGKIKRILQKDAPAKAWLEWAESHGLVLRGTIIACPRCKAKNWHPLAELAPPIVCRGCANNIDRPFAYDSVSFTYRASELLLRLISSDALVHVMALRFLVELFRPGFNRTGPVFGCYPGVNFMEHESSDVIGEADVLLILADGKVAVGECKTRAAGLVDEELAKLAVLATRLDASFTFVATLDSARLCGPAWRKNPHGDGRPHFALTAEHLYDLHPMAIMGSNPLDWREDYIGIGMRSITLDSLRENFATHLTSQRDWAAERQLPWWRRTGE
ncbi:hypothetical protein [Actinoallomurus iriomotensis]|nr:hypothetical protein [Actinoallomurus iriomotensis]